MQNAQMKVQKAAVIAALIIASLVFVYALGFATNMYSLSFHADSTSKTFYVEGAELYYGIQPFNMQLLREALILFLLCIGLFATLTHRRRLYYASNYVSSCLFAVFAVYVGIFNLVNVLFVKNLYLQLDFERIREITEKLRMRFVQSTLMLDCGLVLSVLLFLIAAVLLGNLLWKTAQMRKERREADL